MNHILSASQFDRPLINKILAGAEKMETAVLAGKVPQKHKRKIIACVFFEPSTRTRMSFESSALRLGAGVVSSENAMQDFSVHKGESIEDTTRMLCCYADVIVMRHPKEGLPQAAAKVSTKPIINAGDGGNEHPSQALLDLYTIKQSMGRLENLKVAFGFDPVHSRTIKSAAQLLALYKHNQFTFIAPKSLLPTKEFVKALKAKGAKVEFTQDLKKALASDIFYANRLQQERFSNPKEFEANRKKFIITKQLLSQSKALVMDPLPRIDEVEREADILPNAIYFCQAQNGLYVRMALLQYVLGML
jgi:aspartate carbamoyltransferase catalytic subunit